MNPAWEAVKRLPPAVAGAEIVRAGFLHVPHTDEQAVGKPAGTPSASLAVISKALELAIEAVAKS